MDNKVFSCLKTFELIVGNMVSAKMCTYPKSALISAFWPKSIFLLR